MRCWHITCIALLPLLAAGCGFQPVYGKKSSNNNDVSKVYEGVSVAPISGRSGHQLQMELEDKLNPNGVVPSNPAYRLVANIDVAEVAIGVARDATVSRYNLYIDSRYTLIRNSDGKTITSGSLRHVGSYNNAPSAYFSTYISRDDGIKRGITELAELYRLRISSYLYSGAPEQEIKPERRQPTRYYNTNWPGADPVTGAPVPGAIAIPR